MDKSSKANLQYGLTKHLVFPSRTPTQYMLYSRISDFLEKLLVACYSLEIQKVVLSYLKGQSLAKI